MQISGSSLPAVRVELNPRALFKYGIGLEDVRAALASANAQQPQRRDRGRRRRFQIYTNDQAKPAAEYRPLVVAYRNGAAVRLADVAEVDDFGRELCATRPRQRQAGGAGHPLPAARRQHHRHGRPRQGAAAAARGLDPEPASTSTSSLDRTTTIRASLHDVERTLVISIVLVILVVFVFLRNLRATLIPSVAVPVSLIGTFGVMYLLGYSLDNLSLMALTISTGFVVDDAIVVLENVTRHIEAGMPRMQAALQGAREVGFTVLSMSLSLIAVFMPILLMGGIVGRLFREFAMTLSVAIMMSLVVSLTTTPMMCAYLLAQRREQRHGRALPASERAFTAMLGLYDRTLRRALQWPALVMLILLATLCLNALSRSSMIPKGFFPQQDTGRMIGGIQADQSISFQLMQKKLTQFVDIVRQDPAVADRRRLHRRRPDQFRLRLRRAEAAVRAQRVDATRSSPGCAASSARSPAPALFLQAVQDIRVGGRASNAQYQYTLQGDDATSSTPGRPRSPPALQKVPELTDVNLDQQQKGLEDRSGHRPRHRGAARPHRQPDRQHALRRLRPAPGVDDLHRAQPVSRRHGGGARVLAEPRRR